MSSLTDRRNTLSMGAVEKFKRIGTEYVPFVRDAYGKLKQVAWAPQPGSQAFFLADPTIEVLYEGTRGPGKTDALIMDFCQEVGKGWGAEWRGILFRQTHPQLRDIIEKSKKWIKRIWPEAIYNEVKTMWEWPTGERLYFAHFDVRSDYDNYHGHQYPWIGWEELTNWPSPDCYKSMFSCSRSTAKGMPRKIRATTNPYGCVRFGEVLTERGWVNIREHRDGEKVLSVAPDGTPRMSVAYRHVENAYSGDLITRDGRGLFMEFTEEHRLPWMLTDKSAHRLRGFNDLPVHESLIRSTAGCPWSGHASEFAVPLVKSRKLKLAQPETLTAMQYATLMGWFLSEGSTYDGRFLIAQQKHRDALRMDMDELGFKGAWSANQFTVHNLNWFSYLKRFGKCRDKFIPRALLESSTAVLDRLLDRLMLGDGHWTDETAGHYYTVSKQLADDVSELCVKLGYRTNVFSRQRENRTGISYDVSFCPSKPIWLRQDLISREHFEGEVYCLKVPGDETFFIRQNGCVWLSGNTGHNWVKTRWRLPISGPLGANGKKPTVGPLITDSKDPDGNTEPPRRAIHGYLDENVLLLHADPEYKGRIKASARNASELAAWLDGSWDIVAGGMFDDIWGDVRDTVVVDPFDVPPGWRIYRAYDHGSSKPFSVGWYARSDGTDLKMRDKVNSDGTITRGRTRATVRGDLFRIAEWYGWRGQPNEGSRMLVADIARGIIEKEIKWGLRDRDGQWTRVSRGPADSSIFDDNTNGSDISIASDFEKPVVLQGIKHRGIFWERADKGPGSREQGWEQIRKRLKASKRPPGGYREIPGLFVTSNCVQWLRCVPVLPRDELKIDDVDDESEDHNGDETRYMLRFDSSSGMKTGRVGA